MANKNIRTNVTVTAEAKGFDAVQQKQTKFTDSAAKGAAAHAKGFEDAQKSSISFGKSLEKINKLSFKDAQKQISGLQEHLVVLRKNQFAATEAMESMGDKGGDAYGKIKDHLKSVTQESKTTERQIGRLTKAFATQAVESEKVARSEEKRKGAFVQGMAQGGFSLPAIGLQRGPGMGRQMAGMGVGMGLRGGMGGARAVGSAAFGGVQGMAQGIGAIPIVGGAMASMFTTAAGYAQQNLQYQRTKLDAAPVMESMGDLKARRQRVRSQNAAFNKLEARKDAANSDYNIMEKEQFALMLEKRARIGIKRPERRQAETPTLWGKLKEKYLGGETSGEVSKYDTTPQAISDKLAGMTIPGMAKRIDKLTGLMSDKKKTIDQVTTEANMAFKSASGNPLAGVSSLGVKLMGVSKMDSTQMAGQMAQAGGGYINDANRQGMIGAGFAARTAFGVDAQTSGAFYGAGRRGGLSGGSGGTSGEDFKKTLAEGLEMGLSNSEVNKWMQETAQGIQQFQATGIPINPTSISALAGDISNSGITGTRALAMSRGITGGLQGIGQRGMQSGLDLMLLQLVGGYKGGGAEDYRSARSKLEKLNVEGQGVGEIAGNTKISAALKQIMGFAGGNKASQAELLQQSVTKLGGRGSVEEFDWLARSLRGDKATPDQLEAIEVEKKRRLDGSLKSDRIMKKGGLQQLAGSMVSGYAPDQRTKAGLENEQIVQGGKVVKNVMRLERASMQVTSAFNTLSKDTLTTLTKSLVELTEKVNSAASSGGLINLFNPLN